METTMHSLTKKAAIVTGSTSGIGLAYARAFARAGPNIVLNGFGMGAAIEKERSAIETEFKVKAVYLPADMTRPTEIAEMVGSISSSIMQASSLSRRSL
jgi:3-hydroxybutyrate dehydrogenase